MFTVATRQEVTMRCAALFQSRFAQLLTLFLATAAGAAVSPTALAQAGTVKLE